MMERLHNASTTLSSPGTMQAVRRLVRACHSHSSDGSRNRKVAERSGYGKAYLEIASSGDAHRRQESLQAPALRMANDTFLKP